MRSESRQSRAGAGCPTRATALAWLRTIVSCGSSGCIGADRRGRSSSRRIQRPAAGTIRASSPTGFGDPGKRRRNSPEPRWRNGGDGRGHNQRRVVFRVTAASPRDRDSGMQFWRRERRRQRDVASGRFTVSKRLKIAALMLVSAALVGTTVTLLPGAQYRFSWTPASGPVEDYLMTLRFSNGGSTLSLRVPCCGWGVVKGSENGVAVQARVQARDATRLGPASPPTDWICNGDTCLTMHALPWPEASSTFPLPIPEPSGALQMLFGIGFLFLFRQRVRR